MEDKHINVLMKEYELVNQHWILATRQKAVILQITGSVIVALLGTSFLGHLPWKYFSLIAPLFISVSTLIYTQKEADFWAAAICLESIEKIINKAEGMELLVYAQKFKNILFRRESVVSLSPIRFMQIIRMLPCIGFITMCYHMIYKEYGFRWLCMYILILSIALFYIVYSRFHTMRNAQRGLNERIESIMKKLEST
ncbi:MAG: hypothetical protein ACYSRR_01445 [Planctomycetota bacterium]|jgi:hypothetical protein